MQEQMGQPSLKLIQEMETCWNSTYHMLQRVHEHKGTCRSSFGRSAYEHCPTQNRTVQHNRRISESAVPLQRSHSGAVRGEEGVGIKSHSPVSNATPHTGGGWASLAPVLLQMEKRGSLLNVHLLSEMAPPPPPPHHNRIHQKLLSL